MSFQKAEQLLDFARYAAARRLGLTLDDIVDRYQVSLRTAQRMVRVLELQFPVESFVDEQGRKRWRVSGADLRAFTGIEAEELAAADLAIAHFARSGLELESRALAAFRDKMVALMPHTQVTRLEPDHEALLEAQGFVAHPGPRPKSDPEIAHVLLEALKACQMVDILYRSRTDAEPRWRRVAPYGVLSGARRYLVVREDPSGPIKTFRVDSISEARRTDAFFERPEDFDLQAYANRGFGLYQNDAEYGPVIWRFTPEAASVARATIFHPDQIQEQCADGSLIVRFKAAGHLEMTWYLYQWGDQVEVVEPPKLRAMIEGHRRSDFVTFP